MERMERMERQRSGRGAARLVYTIAFNNLIKSIHVSPFVKQLLQRTRLVQNAQVCVILIVFAIRRVVLIVTNKKITGEGSLRAAGDIGSLRVLRSN